VRGVTIKIHDEFDSSEIGSILDRVSAQRLVRGCASIFLYSIRFGYPVLVVIRRKLGFTWLFRHVLAGVGHGSFLSLSRLRWGFLDV
jgi:hypothetical protein